MSAEIEAWIQKTLAEAPPMTAATRARIARLLSPESPDDDRGDS